MFRIENPSLLYLLLLLIPLWFVFYLSLKNKLSAFSKMGNRSLILAQIPNYSTGKQYVKFYLLWFTFALLIICIANPQLGTTVKKAERKGIDIMIALDISNSMNCEDIQPSRLMRSKQAVIRLLDKLENDRIGIVVFAGDAFLQLPLTSDYGAAKLFISNITTSDMSLQGTAIGKAIELCTESFDPKLSSMHNKAIIVISDGENHEDNALDAARNANRKNIIVSTIGMGLPEGAPIPIYQNGQIVSYKKEANGNIVTTRLNEQMLNEIAQAGHGFYTGANNTSSGIETIFNKLNKLDKASFGARNISDYETRFQYILLFALLFLLLEIFVFEKKNKILNRTQIFGFKTPKNKNSQNRNLNKSKTKQRKTTKATFLFSLVLFFSIGAMPSIHAQVAIPTNKGNHLYQQKDYLHAEEYYLKALSRDSNYHKAQYNLGNAQYRQNRYEQAIESYSKIKESTSLSKDQKAYVQHNLGNSYLKTQQYEQAIEAYKNALKLKPNEENTKYNLAFAQKMLAQQKNQKNQQNQSNKDNQKKDQNQQNKDKQNQQKQDQQNKDKQNQDQQNQKDQNKEQEKQSKGQQNAPQKIKQKEAERMLQALENQEKNTLDKVKKNKTKVNAVQIEKDW
ncbi:MAG: VWA domain-containing protein [Bacteroidales bacterium]